MVAMSIEDPSASTQDDRLLFSLKYQQFEGVIQLAYRIIFRENWIDVSVSVDNIRLVEYQIHFKFSESLKSKQT